MDVQLAVASLLSFFFGIMEFIIDMALHLFIGADPHSFACSFPKMKSDFMALLRYYYRVVSKREGGR